MAGIVVVGAGQAGASLVARLRGLGYDGPVTLLGQEPVPPYQRPPLSKAYLTGALAQDRLFLRPESYYAEYDIDLRMNARVTGIDPAARAVTLDDGTRLGYAQLALTTGARPRRLPAAAGGGLSGVHVLRDLADADAMAPEFRPGLRVLIVGGGYIGLEAAAVAAGKGLKVTLIEQAPRILARVASPETATWFRKLHEGHGVTVLEGVGLDRLLHRADRVCGARLSDGREIGADFVIAGIGVAPETALAEAAGLVLDNGIATDARGRSSDPAIWAAGDCASFPFRGGRVRLESVQNAIDQAETVAANMLGAASDYRPVPWFWSDQYDVKLQIAGLNTGYDRIITRRGSGSSVSFWYYAAGALVAVDAMNDPRAYMVGKRLLEAGRNAPPEIVADPESDLRQLLR